MSKMLKFIKEEKSDFFEKHNLLEAKPEEIKRKIKQCFKFVQRELKI